MQTTAADGAQEFYTVENNIARTETPEEALDLDRRVIRGWIGKRRLPSRSHTSKRYNSLIGPTSDWTAQVYFVFDALQVF